MNQENLAVTRELIEFIRKSPTAFQAVDTISAMLEEDGFIRLSEGGEWRLKPGGRYYLTRNLSSVAAFRIPEKADSFMIAASHTDSPTFKLKNNCEDEACGKYLRLNTECYGSSLFSTWFDRPLSLAGRVVLKDGGRFTAKSVSIDRDLLLIPSVAVHFNRQANDGMKIDPSVDTVPLFSAPEEKGSLRKIVAESAGASEEQLAGMDLYLYNRTPGSIWGADHEFFSAPRIDNLMCAFGTLKGFLSAEKGRAVQVYAAFDNEETGSGSKQGAGSTLLRDTLERIAESLGKDLRRMLASSFMLSADNGHARHPNHPELSDAENAPYMNEGVVIKTNAAQKYTTDGLSAALFTEICRRADVPVQQFANRSDLAGGSTLGGISNTKVPLNTVDIGLAQLAMHSSYETAGCADAAYLIRAAQEFYRSTLETSEDGAYMLL
ncbi:MAG TPA: M18 family aminopeptidase [Oscillospiraceae bacterium]|nr:M18 family aminopeptidase [Oscillospiraceae bacterium]HRW57519.1 M18 family aminopeptidase [Oscillospiraceae bacterium]